MKEIIKEFKEIYKSKIVPMLKEKKELDSKINELDSKINELYSKITELSSKITELSSKITELYSKILKIFSEFDKKHNLVIQWRDYDFKLEGIEFKYHNKNKTGFIFCDMKGETREELFESKIDRVKIIDGKRYVLDE
jgi:chromosome segregation ATPase